MVTDFLPSGHITDNESRWLTVGLALNVVLVPELCRFVETAMKVLYDSLKSSLNIDQQQRDLLKQTYPHWKPMSYKNINSNHMCSSARHYDYKIQSAIDLAVLFLQPFMAKARQFSKCDSSALLGTILNVDDSPGGNYFSGIQREAKCLRDVRNQWAHCHFETWTSAQFNNAFNTMEQLLRTLNVQQEVLDSLAEWRKRGTSKIYNNINLFCTFVTYY